VRQAFSRAIDRTALIDRLMEGVPPRRRPIRGTEGQAGYAADIKPDQHDPEAARRLLAEAGFFAWFPLTIQVPSDRCSMGRVSAAVAQMLARSDHRAGRRRCLRHLRAPESHAISVSPVRRWVVDRRAWRRAGRYRADARIEHAVGCGQSRPLFPTRSSTLSLTMRCIRWMGRNANACWLQANEIVTH